MARRQPHLNGLATLGGENCATFVQAVAKAGGIAEIVTSRVSLPINLVPASERQSLFTTNADGRRSASDALRDPLNTPGTPAYEFKQSHPEFFRAGPNDKLIPDSTSSLLHQNKDGSFTEVIERPDGDSWTNEYTADGVAVSTTQTDGAKNDADYASRTTAYDSQGREDWHSIARDDGMKWRVDFDQKNERSDKKNESASDAQGRVDWERVTQDDGSIQLKDHDQKGERADRVWETAIDAQGRMDWERITQDGGAVVLTDYDQAAERSDRLWIAFTDAQGRKDWERITMNDGTAQIRDYDEKGERSDHVWVTFTDAKGQVVGEEISRDSGQRDNTYYDRDDTRPWVRLERHFDAQNREDSSTVHNDDGSRIETNYDQEDSQPWTSVVKTITSDGVELMNVNYDPGYVEHAGPPPLAPFPHTDATYTSFPNGGGSACVTALGETSCGPRYDVEYGWF